MTEVTFHPDGRVVCAWCDAELKRGNLKSPLSHGICLACMARATGEPIEDLSHIPPDIFDALPFGVIELAGDGIITAYNRAESDLSGLSPTRVVGKNFFRQVAPCTAVQEFQGVLDGLRAKRTNGHAKVRFAFTFAKGTRQVEVAMEYRAATDTSTLLVRVLASELRL